MPTKLELLVLVFLTRLLVEYLVMRVPNLTPAELAEKLSGEHLAETTEDFRRWCSDYPITDRLVEEIKHICQRLTHDRPTRPT
jgi:hypothetical protein